MPKKSAGLLFYRIYNQWPEVFLVHPGGPFWSKKDKGAWSIPKGECEMGEDPFQAAIRETEEETGMNTRKLNLNRNASIELPPARQKSGKIVYAWAIEADFDVEVKSNFFMMEWPPKSGQERSFPEVDKAQWFHLDEAKKKIVNGQIALLEELEKVITN